MGYRYIGSKFKLADFITENIEDIVGPKGHIVDLMTGTGAIALALRKKGYSVTAVDVMTYSYHHAVVCLNIFNPPHFDKVLQDINSNFEVNESLFPLTSYELILKYLNQLKPIKEYFFQEHSDLGKPSNGARPRKYFISENASRIDSIRKKILEWNSNQLLTKEEHSLLLHDLIMAANDVANIAGTYGHYLSKFNIRAKESLKLVPTVFHNDGMQKGHKVIRGYAEEISKNLKCDLCYIDPPYMKRQYAANYHILETIAREDNPASIGISGLRPWRDQYSNFCTKTKIEESIEKIFTNMDCPNFLVSYSDDGLLSINNLQNILKKFGEVQKRKTLYRRFKSQKNDSNKNVTEYLFYIKRF